MSDSYTLPSILTSHLVLRRNPRLRSLEREDFVNVIKGGYWFDGLERVGVIGSNETLVSMVDEVIDRIRSVAA